jgi:N-acetylglutamate synthase-like GNAT family acetyltransferase
MITRIATIADVPRIREIAEITWPVTYSEIITSEQIDFMLNWMYDTTTISNAINSSNQDFIVLIKEGEIIGFSGIEHNYENQLITRIHKLYVLPENQGKNIGLKLFQYAENLTKSMNLNRVFLNVNRFNKAKNFYEKIGMNICKVEDIEIGNGYLMEDFVMEKNL